jgi:hypothetical protein
MRTIRYEGLPIQAAEGKFRASARATIRLHALRASWGVLLVEEAPGDPQVEWDVRLVGDGKPFDESWNYTGSVDDRANTLLHVLVRQSR